MVVQTPETQEEQDSLYNPGDIHAAEQFSGTHASAGIDQAEAFANDPANASEKVKDQEETPTEIPFTGSGGPRNYSRAERVRGFFKDKKKSLPLAGVLGGTGIVGMLFTLFGPMSMVISLTENLLTTNNGAESAYQRRITKVLGVKLADADGVCEVKRVKCKMGRMTTRGLKKLEKKGVVALDAEGNKLSESNSKYPNKQIAKYTVDGIDDPVPAGEMKRRLADNPKIAARILGRSGSFNVRFEVWRGEYLRKNFYDRFSIKRDGGIADGKNKANSKISELTEKLKSKIPSSEGLDENAKAKVRAKADKLIGRGKKGGVVYLTAVGGCIGVKAPGMVGSGVAAVQAARLLPVVSDVILSPGAKNKGSMFTNISSEDVSAAGSLLTATDKNGKSALDSKYLQSAIGVNKNKAGPSKDFSPGYSFLTNSVVRQARSAERKSEKECNAVLSPQAMYTALAVNTAVTVAASSTIIGGIIKVGAEWAASEAVAYVAKEAFEKFGTQIITDLAKNDELDKVLAGEPGEKLGDAVGISAMTFFSSGAAARHVPVLKQSQLITYNNTQQEQSEFQRSMDLASLSPFDVSSKYTFLGSMVNDMNMAIIANRSNTGYATSSLAYLASTPLRLLSPVTSAADEGSSKNYCSYAEEFGMDAENDMTPAVNAAGLPCYGFVANISTEDAIAIATGDNEANEKWVKDDISDLGDEATLDEIVEDDTRLATYLDGCGAGSIESGEWTDAAAGCTVDTNVNPATNAGTGGEKICTGEEKPDVDNCFADTEGIGETVYKSSDAKESEAVAAFAIDYQISQAIDGFDEEKATVVESEATNGSLSGLTMNFASFNVRGASHDGEHGTVNYETRMKKTVETIQKEQFDVIGFQEFESGKKNQRALFKQALGSTYALSNNDAQEDNGNAIGWNTSKYELLKQGTMPDLLYFNGGKLKAPWVQLKEKATGYTFYFANTHDPASVGNSSEERRANATRRTQNANAHVKFMEEKVAAGATVFMAGDFNSAYKILDWSDTNVTAENISNTLTYCIMTSSKMIQNAFDMYKDRAVKCPNKNIDWEAVDPGKGCKTNIDHLYVASSDASIGIGDFSCVRKGDKVDTVERGNGSDHDTVKFTVVVGGQSGDDTVEWPLNKTWWNKDRTDWLGAHTGISRDGGYSGTDWGSDNMGTTEKGAGIAADIGNPPTGTPVYAMVGGVVTSTNLCGSNDGIAIKSKINEKVLGVAYMHGVNKKFKEGDTVKAGDHIMDLGEIGCTVRGAHIHIGIAYDGKYICPQDVFLALDKNQVVDWAALTTKGIATCGR